MKTIAEISTEIGVSKQAVHKKIKRQPLSIGLQGLTTTVDGRLMVNNDGVILIKREFNRKTVNQSDNQSSTKPSTIDGLVDGAIVKLLQENILILQKQLDVKDKQIEELTATVKIQAESINAENKNELAETIIDGNKKLIEENKIKDKGGIFKIFSRKNK